MIEQLKTIQLLFERGNKLTFLGQRNIDRVMLTGTGSKWEVQKKNTGNEWEAVIPYFLL